jgi:hypothetical protein
MSGGWISHRSHRGADARKKGRWAASHSSSSRLQPALSDRVTSAGYLDSTVTSAGRLDCTSAAPGAAETDFNHTIMEAADCSCASGSAAAIAVPAGGEGELPSTL